MGKLVRDRIPELIRSRGQTAVVRVLDDDEYRSALHDKLREEVAELATASPDTVTDEIADVLEVLRAVAEYSGVAWTSVESAASAKRDTRGGFSSRLFLEPVDDG